MVTRRSSLLLFISLVFFTSPTYANWSWNVGYHNPPGTMIGVNALKVWTTWAFEGGVGYFDVAESKKGSSTGFHLLGDVNLKYLFLNGWFRPYLQGGLGISSTTLVGKNTGIGVGSGDTFFGGGVFLFGRPFYVFCGFAFGDGSALQLGIGFDF